MPSLPYPSCDVTYTAMRVAFVVTMDNLLRHSLDPASSYEVESGLFRCYPLLNATCPQVQLECLLRTWSRCVTGGETPDRFDDCVLYAAYESLAKACREDNTSIMQMVANGPDRIAEVSGDPWLYSKARCIQTVASPVKQDQIIVRLSEIHDRTPGLAESGSRSDWETLEAFLELVGRWRAEKSIIFGSSGLLTDDEQDILRAFFEEHPGLVR